MTEVPELLRVTRTRAGGRGAKALENETPDTGLKPGFSTLKPASSTELESALNADLHADANNAVEERPFKGRVEKQKRNNSTQPRISWHREITT